MKPCESKRAYEGKHVFCGGPAPICVLCLKSSEELREEWERAFCPGTRHHRHVYQGGECLGCGREREGEACGYLSQE
jgi:hypothetical protein